MANFVRIYHDGSNGWRMLGTFDIIPDSDTRVIITEDDEDDDGNVKEFKHSFISRNNDGVYENKSNNELLILVES